MVSFKPFKYTEPVIWTAVLFLLFFWTPSETETSLCIFRFMGFQSCPGCGIGHAIHHALHVNLAESWQHHFAGIPAAGMLIYQVFHNLLPIKNKTIQHESRTVPHDASGIATR